MFSAGTVKMAARSATKQIYFLYILWNTFFSKFIPASVRMSFMHCTVLLNILCTALYFWTHTTTNYVCFVRHFRVPLRCKWDLCSYEKLRKVEWNFRDLSRWGRYVIAKRLYPTTNLHCVTSHKPVHILNTYSFSRNVGKCLPIYTASHPTSQFTF